MIYQQIALKSVFPDSIIKRVREESLTWEHSVTPNALGATYRVKLTFTKLSGVKVFIIHPKPLALAEGKTILPHTYSTVEQQLCLYYPDGTQWNSSKLFVQTIIPWACEWIRHYEFWVGTGEWNGGGVHH